MKNRFKNLTKSEGFKEFQVNKLKEEQYTKLLKEALEFIQGVLEDKTITEEQLLSQDGVLILNAMNNLATPMTIHIVPTFFEHQVITENINLYQKILLEFFGYYPQNLWPITGKHSDDFITRLSFIKSIVFVKEVIELFGSKRYTDEPIRKIHIMKGKLKTVKYTGKQKENNRFHNDCYDLGEGRHKLPRELLKQNRSMYRYLLDVQRSLEQMKESKEGTTLDRFKRNSRYRRRVKALPKIAIGSEFDIETLLLDTGGVEEEKRQKKELERKIKNKSIEEQNKLKKEHEERLLKLKRISEEVENEKEKEKELEKERLRKEKEEQEEQERLRKQKEEEEQERLRKQKEEERKRKEEEEQERLRKQKEEEERKRKEKEEQEERKRKEEEEERERLRKQKEEEDERKRKQKEEDERKRRQKNEEERLRKEKEERERLRKQKEEDERKRKEEEEERERKRKQKEEEDERKRKQKEERLRKEKEEKKRLKKEKEEEQERLRKQKEEEERKRKEKEEQERLSKQKQLEERIRKEDEEEEERLRLAKIKEEELAKRERALKERERLLREREEQSKKDFEKKLLELALKQKELEEKKKLKKQKEKEKLERLQKKLNSLKDYDHELNEKNQKHKLENEKKLKEIEAKYQNTDQENQFEKEFDELKKKEKKLDKKLKLDISQDLVDKTDNKLKSNEKTLKGKKICLSGSNDKSIKIAKELIKKGAIPITLSDKNGYISNPNGFDIEQLNKIKELKNQNKPLESIIKTDKNIQYHPNKTPFSTIECDIAIPCQKHGEITKTESKQLSQNGCIAVTDGTLDASSSDAIPIYQRNDILYTPYEDQNNKIAKEIVNKTANKLKSNGKTLKGKAISLSGSNNKTIETAKELIKKGAIPITLSDENGFISNQNGFDIEQLNKIQELKNQNKPMESITKTDKNIQYHPNKTPFSTIECDIAIPCQKNGEITKTESKQLSQNGCIAVTDGTLDASSSDAIPIYQRNDILYTPYQDKETQIANKIVDKTDNKLKSNGKTLKGKIITLSGSNDKSIEIAKELIKRGAIPITLSDENGFISNPNGFDIEQLNKIKELKNQNKPLESINKTDKNIQYHPNKTPFSTIECDIAIPCQKRGEITKTESKQLSQNGCIAVTDGNTDASTKGAIEIYQKNDILYSPYQDQETQIANKIVNKTDNKLKSNGKTLKGKIITLSGSNDKTIETAKELIKKGAIPITLSDENGFISNPNGFNIEQLNKIQELKNQNKPLESINKTDKNIQYHPNKTPFSTIECDIAIPCQKRGEITKTESKQLSKNGCIAVTDGTPDASTSEAIPIYQKNDILYTPYEDKETQIAKKLVDQTDKKLKSNGKTLKGKTITLSGSNDKSIETAKELIKKGAIPITLSDENGYIHNPNGFDIEQLNKIQELKNQNKPLESINKTDKNIQYHPNKTPFSTIECDIAIPCQKNGEITKTESKQLSQNGCIAVTDGTPDASTSDAIPIYQKNDILYSPYEDQETQISKKIVDKTDNKLKSNGKTLKGKVISLSGSNDKSIEIAKELIKKGAIPITLSDKNGYIHNPNGFDIEQLNKIKELKNQNKPLQSITKTDKNIQYHPNKTPFSTIECDVAIPCQKSGEITKTESKQLSKNGCIAVIDGTPDASTKEAITIYQKNDILYSPYEDKETQISKNLVDKTDKKLKSNGKTLKGKKICLSGSNDKTIETAKELIKKGAIPITLSDKNGYIHHPNGFDIEQLNKIKELKNQNKPIESITKTDKNIQYHPNKTPFSTIECDIAIPCQKRGEITKTESKQLSKNGCIAVTDGTQDASSSDAIPIYQKNDILYTPYQNQETILAKKLVDQTDNKLKSNGKTLKGKKITLSGSNDKSIETAKELIKKGAIPITLSDENGYIHHPNGFDIEQLNKIKELKNQNKPLKLIIKTDKNIQYHPNKTPFSTIKCDIAIPCQKHGEITKTESKQLSQNGCIAVTDGTPDASSSDAIEIYQKNDILYSPYEDKETQISKKIVNKTDNKLKSNGKTLKGKTITLSGSNDKSIKISKELIKKGAIPITLSDENGFVYNPNGFDIEQLNKIKELKNQNKPMESITKTDKNIQYHPNKTPFSTIECDIAIPCQKNGEITKTESKQLSQNGCIAVTDGTQDASSSDAIEIYQKNDILYSPYEDKNNKITKELVAKTANKLKSNGKTLKGKTISLSGYNNKSIETAKELIKKGAIPITLSDENGFLHNPNGFDIEQLNKIQELRNQIKNLYFINKTDKNIQYHPNKTPFSTIKCDIAIPCQKTGEITKTESKQLSQNGCIAVTDGAPDASTRDAIPIYQKNDILYIPYEDLETKLAKKLVDQTDKKLKSNGKTLKGKTITLSGSNDKSIETAKELIKKGAIPITLSDENGFISNQNGFDIEQLNKIQELKNQNKPMESITKTDKNIQYHPNKTPFSTIECDIAIPCQKNGEITKTESKQLSKNGCIAVTDGTQDASTNDAIEIYQKNDILYSPYEDKETQISKKLVDQTDKKLKSNGKTLKGKKICLSGSNDKTIETAKELIKKGAIPITLSDENGFLHNLNGFNIEQLNKIKELKNQNKPLESINKTDKNIQYHPNKTPFSTIECDIAIPCQKHGEITKTESKQLSQNGCIAVTDGTQDASTKEAITIYQKNDILYSPYEDKETQISNKIVNKTDKKLKSNGKTLKGKTITLSGSNDKSIETAKGFINKEAFPITLSDENGFISNLNGFDIEQLNKIQELKNQNKPLESITKTDKNIQYHPNKTPFSTIECDIAIPCQKNGEITKTESKQLSKNGCIAVTDGTQDASTNDAIEIYQKNDILYSPYEDKETQISKKLVDQTDKKLKSNGKTLKGKKICLSGSNDKTIETAKELIKKGAIPITLSDENGFLHNLNGFNFEQLNKIKELKNQNKPLESINKTDKNIQYHPNKTPFSTIKCDIAIPCQKHGEITKTESKQLSQNGCIAVTDGTPDASTNDAIEIYQKNDILYSPYEDKETQIATKALLYLTDEMLKSNGKTLKGKIITLSGSNDKSIEIAKELIKKGAIPITLSDENGYIHNPNGFDIEQLNKIQELKNQNKPLESITKIDKNIQYHPNKSPFSKIKCDIAIPCQKTGEITKTESKQLSQNGCIAVTDGTQDASTKEAIEFYQKNDILYSPYDLTSQVIKKFEKFEKEQNKSGKPLSNDVVEKKLKEIIKNIFNNNDLIQKEYSEKSTSSSDESDSSNSSDSSDSSDSENSKEMKRLMKELKDKEKELKKKAQELKKSQREKELQLEQREKEMQAELERKRQLKKEELERKKQELMRKEQELKEKRKRKKQELEKKRLQRLAQKQKKEELRKKRLEELKQKQKELNEKEEELNQNEKLKLLELEKLEKEKENEFNNLKEQKDKELNEKEKQLKEIEEKLNEKLKKSSEKNSSSSSSSSSSSNSSSSGSEDSNKQKKKRKKKISESSSEDEETKKLLNEINQKEKELAEKSKQLTEEEQKRKLELENQLDQKKKELDQLEKEKLDKLKQKELDLQKQEEELKKKKEELRKKKLEQLEKKRKEKEELRKKRLEELKQKQKELNEKEEELNQNEKLKLLELEKLEKEKENEFNNLKEQKDKELNEKEKQLKEDEEKLKENEEKLMEKLKKSLKNPIRSKKGSSSSSSTSTSTSSSRSSSGSEDSNKKNKKKNKNLTSESSSEDEETKKLLNEINQKEKELAEKSKQLTEEEQKRKLELENQLDQKKQELDQLEKEKLDKLKQKELVLQKQEEELKKKKEELRKKKLEQLEKKKRKKKKN
ncbi:nadp-specific glutamate dehydrogenase 1-related [Anaeramoeba flamelloides]|uniref:Nadp-specific glutamate dehydrogenase 1-related n=1 Tax=Anaeramoeba flamelloides TaxID=1746091 RepID=A0AAV7YQK4_9EUKA|nr:nadp-specific glutamate dehydrogenase 1-related [Anaeramoeba flamelloides]